jgi:dipeptidyl aminopeptidase/acylaminoacyl peptidase
MFAFHRGVLSALAASVLFATAAYAQSPSAQTVTVTADKAPIPVGDFFRHASFGGASMSPDGRHVAMTIADDRGILNLVLLPLDTRVPKILVHAASDVAEIRWVNDKRIAFSFVDRKVGLGDRMMGPGLYAINIDGTGLLELATRNPNILSVGAARQNVLGWRTAMLAHPGKQDSDFIYVTHVTDNGTREAVLDLLKLDTVTGVSTKVARPGRTVDWMLDEEGEPRVAITVEGPHGVVNYLDPETRAWRRLFSSDARSVTSMDPLAVGPNGTLYVTARNGRDKESLYVYDIKSGKLVGDPLVSTEDYDFAGTAMWREGRMVGVTYETDAPGTLWLDPQRAALQKDIDTLLPATNNLLGFPRRPTMPYILVRASSDREPGATFLYNVQTKKLSPLGRRLPHIDATRMAEKEPVRYKARDGLPIPAYLTLPNGAKKNLPMVLLVHGGPWVRGVHWNFNPQAQFLASRGYAVLEPEARGSTGYGARHFKSSFKQWGLSMQDDLTDGVRWAIAQGIADPKRICIAGASYGGYATLMGLIKEPELFRCGIDWVGVTDINLMYDVHWSDTGDAAKLYGMPVMIGDQKLDAEQLKATSPLVNAARIKQPLLLAYGGEDVRVPLIHGTKFRDAVSATNKDVEWVVYPEEGHGWELEANNVDFWTRVEKFLDRTIGPGAAK